MHLFRMEFMDAETGNVIEIREWKQKEGSSLEDNMIMATNWAARNRKLRRDYGLKVANTFRLIVSECDCQ